MLSPARGDRRPAAGASSRRAARYFCTRCRTGAAREAALPGRRRARRSTSRSSASRRRAIAEMAGLSVPAGTRALVVRPAGVGRDHALSHELLCPVLKWYPVATEEEGARDRDGAAEVRRRRPHGGDLGRGPRHHRAATAACRPTASASTARRCSARWASRPASMPSFTLGTGTIGGAISSDNIGPQHLINRKRVGARAAQLARGGHRRGPAGGVRACPAAAPAAPAHGATGAPATAHLALPPLPAAQAALMSSAAAAARAPTAPPRRAPRPHRHRDDRARGDRGGHRPMSQRQEFSMRAYAYIDSMQPEFAAYVGATVQGSPPGRRHGRAVDRGRARQRGVPPDGRGAEGGRRAARDAVHRARVRPARAALVEPVRGEGGGRRDLRRHRPDRGRPRARRSWRRRRWSRTSTRSRRS